MAINLQSLDNSGYVLQSQIRRLGRTIYRYLLEDNITDRTVQAATQALTNLTEQNPNLVPLYQLENLGQRVRQNEYLVINGSAVALSSEPKATSEFERKTTDAYFSEAPLREPVVCKRGHSFEREHIQFWVAVKGDICPYQENHAVGDIIVDDEILDDVQRARALRAAVQDVGNDNRCLKVVAQSGQITTSRQQEARNQMAIAGKGVGGVAKITTKVTRSALVKAACKGTETCAIHSFVKKVPIVSVVLGLIMGLVRLRRGEGFLKAGAEVASGVAACSLGMGTVVSYAIDAVLLTQDGLELCSSANANVMTFAIATALLDLDANAERHTEREISRAYRKAMLVIHPDRLQQIDPVFVERFDQLSAVINEAMDFLRTHYGYA